MRLCWPVTTFVFLLALIDLANAQLPTGSIDGICKDASGRLVQGAHILATADLQGFMRETDTNSDGSFTLSDLASGTYTVVLSSPGFSDLRYAHVQVEPGRATTLDSTLQVAAQAATVSVGADAGQSVDLTQSLLQGQISTATIQGIPLNGRNFLELAFLIPGDRPAPTFDPTKTNTLEISSAGGFGRGGNILVDGADNNLPPFPQNASTTKPALGLTNELLFPDLVDGANFNLPQAWPSLCEGEQASSAACAQVFSSTGFPPSGYRP